MHESRFDVRSGPDPGLRINYGIGIIGIEMGFDESAGWDKLRTAVATVRTYYAINYSFVGELAEWLITSLLLFGMVVK